MRVDIIKRDNGAAAVYPHRTDCEWEDDGKPLYEADNADDCIDWAEDNGHRFCVKAERHLVDPSFVRDLEAKCDRWHERMREAAAKCGRHIQSDITYRASANWKEDDTHYAYNGDMGGVARLVRDGGEIATADADALAEANTFLDMLIGASAALWELGFNLTFNKDGKHKVYGSYAEWVTIEEN